MLGNGTEYTLFVVDLLFPRDPRSPSKHLVPDGLKAVDYAALSYPQMVIIAVSVAETVTHFSGIRENFFEQGGDAYFSKAMIDLTTDVNALYQRMGREIEQALRKKGRLPIQDEGHLVRQVTIKSDSRNLILQAQIETVHENTMKVLVEKIFPDCRSFFAHYLLNFE
jgi:hypothetical protein